MTMQDAADSAVPRSHLWEEYEQLTDLYKFYLDLILSASGGFYLVTAAIVTFVFAQETGDDRLALALLLPWLVSTAAVFATSKAIPMAREHEERVVELAGTLTVGLAPHVRLLVWTVQGLRLALATTSVGLVGLAVLV